MRRLSLLACLVLLAPAAPSRADSLYRCIGPKGEVSYQAQGCAAGQRLDRVLDYRPDPVVPQPVVRSAPVSRSIKTSRLRSVRGTRIVTASDRCRASKAQREVALQRLGLSRTYQQLSSLDAPVRAACGGF